MPPFNCLPLPQRRVYRGGEPNLRVVARLEIDEDDAERFPILVVEPLYVPEREPVLDFRSSLLRRAPMAWRGQRMDNVFSG